MDTPTAMVMATTYGVAAYGRRLGLAGGLLCAAGALLPDLDGVFWGETGTYLRWHRGPSHALLAIAVLTPVLAWVVQRLGSKKPFRLLCGAAAIGLAVAVGTDVVTWWGTQVLWPFSDRRLGIGLIFIIDLWHSGIVTLPFLAWGVVRLRGGELPVRAFRVATAASLLWIFGVCGTGHVMARVQGADLAEKQGAELLDVLPQPFSPFRWAFVLGTPAERTIVYHDVFGSGPPLEQRSFPTDANAQSVIALASPDQRRFLEWVFRHPYETATERADGATELVFEDLAYQLYLPEWYGPPRWIPFRYRFVIRDDEVVDEGWIERE